MGSIRKIMNNIYQLFYQNPYHYFINLWFCNFWPVETKSDRKLWWKYFLINFHCERRRPKSWLCSFYIVLVSLRSRCEAKVAAIAQSTNNFQIISKNTYIVFQKTEAFYIVLVSLRSRCEANVAAIAQCTKNSQIISKNIFSSKKQKFFL